MKKLGEIEIRRTFLVGVPIHPADRSDNVAIRILAIEIESNGKLRQQIIDF